VLVVVIERYRRPARPCPGVAATGAVIAGVHRYANG